MTASQFEEMAACTLLTKIRSLPATLLIHDSLDDLIYMASYNEFIILRCSFSFKVISKAITVANTNKIRAWKAKSYQICLKISSIQVIFPWKGRIPLLTRASLSVNPKISVAMHITVSGSLISPTFVAPLLITKLSPPSRLTKPDENEHLVCVMNTSFCS